LIVTFRGPALPGLLAFTTALKHFRKTVAAIACLAVAKLRFGVVSESVREGRAWLDFVRRVEGSGIDVLLLRDHFSAGAFGQQLAPFSGLAAAAAVTTRLRLGTFIITGQRRARTEDLIVSRGWTGIDVEAVWQMPTIFIGSLEQIRSDLRARRERFGLSYLVVGEDGLPALAEIVSGL
jgi:hypothetical protein